MKQNTIIKATNACVPVTAIYSDLLSIDLGHILQFVVTIRVGIKTQSIQVKGIVEYVYDDIAELADNETSQTRKVYVSLLYASRFDIDKIVKKLSEPQDTSADNDILLS